MMYALAFLSGIVFSFFLLLVWSLCRTAADADKLAERLDDQERGDR